MTVTNAVLKVTWAIQIVSIPLPSGQPIACSMDTKMSNRESPVITSGMTSGAVIVPANVKCPRNHPKRTRARDAIKPRTGTYMRIKKQFSGSARLRPKFVDPETVQHKI